MDATERDEPLRPVYNFFLSTLAFTLVALPLVATVDRAALDGLLGGSGQPVASVALAIPAAFEFAFSGRDPFLVGKYVVAFLVCYFLVIVGQAAVYVSLGIPEPIPLVEFGLLFGTYLVAYLLVYRGGYDRLKRAIGG